jgi:ubiquitin-protein ligase
MVLYFIICIYKNNNYYKKIIINFLGDNLLNWIATIKGSKGTVYEGLEYRLTFQFPATYPYEAPHVTFSTPCFQ